MDLFNRKRIVQLEDKIMLLENVISARRADINRLEASELRLMGEIRDMDQLIFQMGQMDSWARQRPIFNKLQAKTEHRMRDESNRIKTLLIPEMQKAYRK
jgi:hypothetical protein